MPSKFKICICIFLHFVVCNEHCPCDRWKLHVTFLIEYLSYTLCHLCTGCVTQKGTGKAVPLQAWSGPEGSRKLRFPDYMATAQDGGKVVSLTHRPPLPPGNAPDTHFC
jgi:hypothetical protein